MSQQLLNGKPIKLLWFGDLVGPSGFGRIGNEVCQRMVARKWQVVGASINWPGYPWNPLPFPIFGMARHDIWAKGSGIANAEQPDVIVCCQDFPYSQTLFNGARIDFSKTKFIIVTPIDGTPVHPEWLKMVDIADATMVISRFGVEALRMAGKQVDLLHPGVDTNEFYPAKDAGEIKALREKVGIAPDAFVFGMAAMNQGRKAISATIELFREFARAKPEAVLYLDMEKVSPAGWDIPVLLEQMRVDPTRVKYREDAFKAGIDGLRERFLLMDVHSVVSHREGFGLPLLESMACKLPTMALDWCSGTEIVGGGKGALIRRLPYMEYGTWGGARDAFPDMKDWLGKLNHLYRNPDMRDTLAARGYEWAVKQTWDVAADQFETVLKRVMETERTTSREPNPNYTIPAPGHSDDGAGDSGAVPADAHAVNRGAGLQQFIEGHSGPQQSVGNGRPDANGNLSAG